jgi:hypothetical protein
MTDAGKGPLKTRRDTELDCEIVRSGPYGSSDIPITGASAIERKSKDVADGADVAGVCATVASAPRTIASEVYGWRGKGCFWPCLRWC